MPPDPDRVLTVLQLTRKIKTLLQFEIGEVWVEGEVSNLRKQSSGHRYFTLKDSGAQLSCVLFRGNARNLRADLEEGQQVQAFGEIDVYEARGNYQLIVRLIQSKGLGALQAKFEALKAKLDTEGLFDSSSKKAIPSFPSKIALVTSPTGAALQDMLNILSRRAPWVEIYVYPVQVQGKGAERGIARAIQRLANPEAHGLPRVDTIVVGRGGGSIEDLWNFNEEIVARAIHACEIPVVSAVGHEIDFTIADFVADLRAPTPSAAAELIVPDREELMRRLQSLKSGMELRLQRGFEARRSRLEFLARTPLLHDPVRQLGEFAQEADRVRDELDEAVDARMTGFHDRLSDFKHRLAMRDPRRIMQQRVQAVALIRQQLDANLLRLLARKKELLHSAQDLLKHLDPQSVFNRGFSMTTNASGRVLLDPEEVDAGEELTTRLARGKLKSRVEK